MRILDRYILKELLGPFFFGICVFASILVGTGPLFRIAQYISQYGASLWTCVKLLTFSLPGIIALTFPMAMLLASLMSFGRLSSSSEIVAMKCGGLSFYRLAAPVFLVAFGVSMASIRFLMSYVKKHDFKFFGVYRIALGLVVLAAAAVTALR